MNKNNYRISQKGHKSFIFAAQTAELGAYNFGLLMANKKLMNMKNTPNSRIVKLISFVFLFTVIFKKTGIGIPVTDDQMYYVYNSL